MAMDWPCRSGMRVLCILNFRVGKISLLARIVVACIWGWWVGGMGRGNLHLESAGRAHAGIPTAEQIRAMQPFVQQSFDVFIGEAPYVLAPQTIPGTVPVNEWLLNRAGWIDEKALPKSQVPTAVVAISNPSVRSKAREDVVKTARRSGKEPWVPIVKMQEGSGGELLVLVADSSGSPEIYRDLIQALGPSRRILGIAARGEHSPEACHPSIESAAAQYIAALLEEENPVTWKLAGFGFGAVVALEMARQLDSAGRTLPQLVFIGAALPMVLQPVGWLESVKKALKKHPILPKWSLFLHSVKRLSAMRVLGKNIASRFLGFPQPLSCPRICRWKRWMSGGNFFPTPCSSP